MDVRTLLDLASGGDREAFAQIIALQREGRALRLYPNGRRGADDPGVAPLEIGLTEQYLVRINLGRPMPITLTKPLLGPAMKHIMRSVGMTVYFHRDAGDVAATIESLVTPGFGFVTRREGDKIITDLKPDGLATYDFAYYHGRKLIRFWLQLIDQADWEWEDCGFTADEYAVLSGFAGDDDHE